MGGCQNYGHSLGTLNISCRIIIGTQKGTIILTTTHIYRGFSGSIIELIQGDTRSLDYSGSFPLYPWGCVPQPWNMVLDKGIWDTQPRVTNIKGAN